MSGPIKWLKNKLSATFGLMSANTGWDHKEPPPKLSPEKKKDLLASSSLETPRSVLRGVWGVIKPYWTKSGAKEIAIASALLGTTLGMSYEQVQMRVDYSKWSGALVNAGVSIFQEATASREKNLPIILEQLPELKKLLDGDPELAEIIKQYPDRDAMIENPKLKAVFAIGEQDTTQNKANREFRQYVAEQYPGMPDIVQHYQMMKDHIESDPKIMAEVRKLAVEIGKSNWSRPEMKEKMGRMINLLGGNFVGGWKNAATEHSKEAFAEAWDQKDIMNIVTKFLIATLAGYLASSYLAMRWRAWNTGHYIGGKYMEDNTFARLKEKFSNIDNPDQRFQEDPNTFANATISFLQNVLNCGMLTASFGAMLYNISGQFNLASMGGPDFEVKGLLFGLALAYSGGVTWATAVAGKKLAQIERNRQKYEGGFRAIMRKIYEKADTIAQSRRQLTERQQAHDSFKAIIKNAGEQISTQKKLVIINSIAGNTSIPIPHAGNALLMALGESTFGTGQTVNYAFQSMMTAFGLVSDNYATLAATKAVADRMYTQDQAMDLVRFETEEKRQAHDAVEAELRAAMGPQTLALPPTPPPSAPPGPSNG